MGDAASLGTLASRFIETESVPWIETTPGNKMKVIYHDPATGMLTILARLEPGAGIPAHVHEDLEQTFVLEGSLVDDEGECTAGNFVIRAKGSRHAPTAPKGCNAGVLPQAHGGACQGSEDTTITGRISPPLSGSSGTYSGTFCASLRRVRARRRPRHRERAHSARLF